MQESFVIFTESWSGIQLLSREQKGDLLQALMAEHGVCSMPEMDQVTTVVFQMMMPRMRANRKKYEEEIERRKAAGKKGGESRGKNQAQLSNAKECLANTSTAKQSEAMLSNAKECLAEESKKKECLAIQAVSDSDPDSVTDPDSDPDTDPSIEGEENLPPIPPAGGDLIESVTKPTQGKVVDDSLPAKKYRRDEFVAWFEAYPNQVKKKPAARSWENAIKKKALPSLDFLLADIERQKGGNPRWLDGYVPDPTTYLNERRWNDKFTPRQSAPYQPQQARPAFQSGGYVPFTNKAMELIDVHNANQQVIQEVLADLRAEEEQKKQKALGGQ